MGLTADIARALRDLDDERLFEAATPWIRERLFGERNAPVAAEPPPPRASTPPRAGVELEAELLELLERVAAVERLLATREASPAARIVRDPVETTPSAADAACTDALRPNLGDAAPTRDQSRSRRKREVRARTITARQMTKREIELGRILFPEDTSEGRPRTRADCVDGPRPCPWVACAYHLYLDVSPQTGSIKLNFPDVDVEELEQLRETCVLDVCARGGITLEVVAELLNMTRERVRQIETAALRHVARVAADRGLGEHVDGVRRRLPVVADEDDAGAAGDGAEPDELELAGE